MRNLCPIMEYALDEEPTGRIRIMFPVLLRHSGLNLHWEKFREFESRVGAFHGEAADSYNYGGFSDRSQFANTWPTGEALRAWLFFFYRLFIFIFFFLSPDPTGMALGDLTAVRLSQPSANRCRLLFLPPRCSWNIHEPWDFNGKDKVPRSR